MTRFQFLAGVMMGFFIFATMLTWPTQPPNQWVLGALSPEVK